MLIDAVWKIAARGLERNASARDRAVAVQALTLLLGYGQGRPVQRQELSGPGGDPLGLELASMSTQALQARVLELVSRWPAGSRSPIVGPRLEALKAPEDNVAATRALDVDRGDGDSALPTPAADAAGSQCGAGEGDAS